MTRTAHHTRHRVDTIKLFTLVDQQRRDRGLSWRGLAAEIGVSGSMPLRLRRGESMTADTLLTLMTWVGLSDIRQVLTAREARS